MTGRDKRGGENGNKKDERMNVKNMITGDGTTEGKKAGQIR